MGKRIFIDYSEYLAKHMSTQHPTGTPNYSGAPNWFLDDFSSPIREYVLKRIKKTAATHVLIESNYYFDFIQNALDSKDIIEMGKDGEFPFMYWMGIKIEGIPKEEADKLRILK